MPSRLGFNDIHLFWDCESLERKWEGDGHDQIKYTLHSKNASIGAGAFQIQQDGNLSVIFNNEQYTAAPSENEALFLVMGIPLNGGVSHGGFFGQNALNYLKQCPANLSTAAREKKQISSLIRDLYPKEDVERIEGEIWRDAHEVILKKKGEAPLDSHWPEIRERVDHYIQKNPPPYSENYFRYLVDEYDLDHGHHVDIAAIRRRLPKNLSGVEGSQIVREAFEGRRLPSGIVTFNVDFGATRYPFSKQWEMRKRLLAIVEGFNLKWDGEDWTRTENGKELKGDAAFDPVAAAVEKYVNEHPASVYAKQSDYVSNMHEAKMIVITAKEGDPKDTSIHYVAGESASAYKSAKEFVQTTQPAIEKPKESDTLHNLLAAYERNESRASDASSLTRVLQTQYADITDDVPARQKNREERAALQKLSSDILAAMAEFEGPIHARFVADVQSALQPYQRELENAWRTEDHIALVDAKSKALDRLDQLRFDLKSAGHAMDGQKDRVPQLLAMIDAQEATLAKYTLINVTPVMEEITQKMAAVSLYLKGNTGISEEGAKEALTEGLSLIEHASKKVHPQSNTGKLLSIQRTQFEKMAQEMARK